MTIVKSPLFTSLWDKLGGLEFRRRRNKKIELAKKRVPTNPRTEKQQFVRQAYGKCVEKYNKLSEEEKKIYAEKYKSEGLDAYRAFMRDCLKQNRIPVDYEITIDNTQNSNDLADYQVLLVVNADQTFFNTFYNDHKYIEAYDSDKQTAINFYVEEWDINNYNAKIWFKIPSIPANSTKEIYLKANLNRTESLSNPEQVFEFFDHFDTPDKWSLYTGASIHDSVLDYTLGSNDYVVEKTTKLPSRNIIIEHLTKVISRTGPSAGVNIMLPTTEAGGSDRSIPGYWYLVAFESAGYYKIYKHKGTTYGKIREIAYRIPTGQWLRCKTVINETENGIRIRFYVNDKLIDDFTDTTPIPPDDGYLAFREGDMEHDWVFVRKYTEPEPAVTYKRL